jgi:hypothetical protein
MAESRVVVAIYQIGRGWARRDRGLAELWRSDHTTDMNGITLKPPRPYNPAGETTNLGPAERFDPRFCIPRSVPGLSHTLASPMRKLRGSRQTR